RRTSRQWGLTARALPSRPRQAWRRYSEIERRANRSRENSPKPGSLMKSRVKDKNRTLLRQMTIVRGGQPQKPTRGLGTVARATKRQTYETAACLRAQFNTDVQCALYALCG